MTRTLLLKTAVVMVPAVFVVGAIALTRQDAAAAEAPVVDAGVVRAPGPDRNVAAAAVAAARNAVDQAGKDSEHREQAAAQLAQAEALLAAGQYREAAAAADNAWRLVSGKSSEKTKFTVEVSADGKTEVRATSGQTVRVEAQGVTEPLHPGETVVVARGEPPRRAPPSVAKAEPPPAKVESAPKPLAAPQPVAPSDKDTVVAKAQKSGVGPVLLKWKPVTGAVAYEVEVTPATGKSLQLRVKSAQARIRELPEGSYAWTVRAVDGAARSEQSPKRTFELRSDGLKLEVKGTDWK